MIMASPARALRRIRVQTAQHPSAGLEVVPRHQQEPTDQAQMFEEAVRGHLPVRHGKFPEPIGDDGRNGRETGQPQGAQPAKPTAQHQRRPGELRDDRGYRDRHRRRQAEMLHLGDRAGEVQQLADATLQIGGAEPEQRNETDDRQCRDRSRAAHDRGTHCGAVVRSPATLAGLLLLTAALSGMTQCFTSGTSCSPPTMPSKPASATSGGAGERTPISA
jgi:hypothetical protein